MMRLKIIIPASVCLFFLLIGGSTPLKSQALPEIFDEGTLVEQYDYLQERTRIYDNFRAIREDMFRKIRRNSLDSLNSAFTEIRGLNQQIVRNRNEKDSLLNVLNIAIEERDLAIRDRDSLFLFGIPMSKSFYNILLWSIIGGLALLFVISGILFKRANVIARQKTKETNELQSEYEEYRKTSRERYEQQSIDHFNEIKRIRGI